MNLTANARDAMPDGGLITIGTQLQEIDTAFVKAHGFGVPGRYAVLSVKDNGDGMDEQTRRRIFEPFFTTKEVGKGTGLGLAMVYAMVKQHDGSIQVSSEPGSGATFRIYLPIIQESPKTEDVAEPKPTPGTGDETILIAEDEPSVRQLVEAILTEYGYKVILAEDGKDAVDKFRLFRKSIRLVLMDLIMPKKTGKQAYDEIRQLQPDVKVLFTSGYLADIIRNQGRLEEGMELLMKPVQPPELLAKVREMLDR
jgi:polar amino acid transport system substrate-binding protein